MRGEDEYGFVTRGAEMRTFLQKFEHHPASLADHKDGPRVTVSLKTGERQVEQAAARRAQRVLQTRRVEDRIRKRARQLIDLAVEDAARRAAEWELKAMERRRVILRIEGPDTDAVLLAVFEATQVTPAELLGDRRQRKVAYPRWLAFWLLKNLRQGMSLPAIGKAMLKDHTTVMAGLRRFEELKDTEPFASWLTHDAIVQLMNSGETP